MQLKASLRGILLFIALLLLIPGIIWLAQEQTLGVFSIVALSAAVFIALIALTSSSEEIFWPWFLGVFFLLMTPFLLLLGGLISRGEVRSALYAWVYVYAAGVTGGLVLELIKGKGRLELPSYVPGATSEPHTLSSTTTLENPGSGNGQPLGTVETARTAETPATTVPATGETEPEAPEPEPPDDHPFAPYGPRADTGFLARLALGGLAGAVFTALIEVLANSVEVAQLGTVGRELDTLAWSALFGFAALTAWAAAEGFVNSRLEIMKSSVDAARAAVSSATSAAESALDTTQQAPDVIVVDPQALGADSEHVALDQLTRYLTTEEHDPTLRRASAAVKITPSVSQPVQRQLAEAVGSLKAAQRILDSAQRRARRR